ncbi:MAG: hypothetical protein LHW56_09405 [Candidatus Cloacimonetes bacterium]|jgi:hypothetical protein|nr:hypothetical protein [Candidatus Cloacimonadota bacterium]MDY0173108.1 hypothetical protein [Candidatus Cloacimonadaceae bacterium]
MKRYILLAMLCLGMAFLMAETGLFDLSYGQNMAEAHKALLAKGFQETQRNAKSVSYINSKIPGLNTLEVMDYFQNGTVSEWTARYDVKDKAKLAQELISDLTAIHGKESTQIYLTHNRWWKLANPYALQVRFSDDLSILTIEYQNDTVAQDKVANLKGWLDW